MFVRTFEIFLHKMNI